MNPAAALLIALALILAPLLAYNHGQRRALRQLPTPQAPLFVPIPSPWWAMPHLETECVNAQCRVHYPFAQCMGVVDDEWCRKGRDHKGDCEADLTSYLRKSNRRAES